ncbi:MAG: hypothetical protein K8T89_06815 [Planctomycetes bacterium]|nr:hypothetical protein [Planctomycetota bacterium]
MSEPKCPNCAAALEPNEVALGWCASCGKEIPAAVRGPLTGRPIEAPTPDPRSNVEMSPRDSAVCLLCQESTTAEICYLRLIRIELEFQRKITRWTDIRARCCEDCRRKVEFANRTEGIRVVLRILLLAGMFAGYVILIPPLLAAGVPGAVVGFGAFVPILFIPFLWRLTASHRWRSMMSPRTIERFKAMGINWDANHMSGISITRESVPGGSYVEMTER